MQRAITTAAGICEKDEQKDARVAADEDGRVGVDASRQDCQHRGDDQKRSEEDAAANTRERYERRSFESIGVAQRKPSLPPKDARHVD